MGPGSEMLPGSLTHQARLSADSSSLAQAQLQRTLPQGSTQPSLTGAGGELWAPYSSPI